MEVRVLAEDLEIQLAGVPWSFAAITYESLIYMDNK